MAGAGLIAALFLMVVSRTWIPFGDIFRDGEVFLAANDPYAFRYMVDHLFASGLHPFNPFDWGEIPESIRTHDVAFVAMIWAFATLLGGSAYAGGVVLAIYPVIVAVLVGVMVYLVSVWMTQDRRVGVLAVVLLALTPAHVYRTMLGFGDHDAFGYLAAMTTVAALIWLLRADEVEQFVGDPKYLLAVVLAGAGTVAATFGWRGGPMLFAPIALFVVFSPVVALRYDRSPLRAHRGMVLGLGVGAVLGIGMHLVFGWGQPIRAIAPLLMFVLVFAVVGIGESIHRLSLPWPVALGPIPLGALVIVGGLWSGHPMFADAMDEFRWFLVRPARDIGELVTLTDSLEVPLLMFGFLLLVAIPVMLWILAELFERERLDWLLFSSYAWAYVGLASVAGLRMSGLAAMFIVVFGAIGVVALADWMDLVEPLRLFRDRDRSLSVSSDIDMAAVGRSLAIVALIVLLVLGTGLMQIPGTMDAITHDETLAETTTAINEYGDANDLTYPETYVLTEWGSNRAYNYHVNGESRSYGFARTHYREFVSSSEPEEWDDVFDDRVGFVVVQETRFTYPEDSMQVRLFDGDGKTTPEYELIHVSEDGSTKVFLYEHQ